MVCLGGLCGWKRTWAFAVRRKRHRNLQENLQPHWVSMEARGTSRLGSRRQLMS